LDVYRIEIVEVCYSMNSSELMPAAYDIKAFSSSGCSPLLITLHGTSYHDAIRPGAEMFLDLFVHSLESIPWDSP